MRPGAGTLRAEVVRNQSERLFAAMVAVVSEKGYEATTVADLVALSGVSRSDFYKHFASKRDCFVAMVEAIVEPMMETIAKARASADERRVREVFEAFIGMTVRQPATARVCIVELHAAGEEAERVIDQVFEAFEQLVAEASKRIAGREGMPPQIVRAVIGGLRKVLHTRIYRGEVSELEKLAPELWEWGLSYQPPSQPLRSRRRSSAAPSRFEGYTQAERIARAVTAVTAEKGYQTMSTDDIAERASISLSTFYSHFADKRDAVLAALEMGGAQMLASVVPAAQRAEDWREGVRIACEAMCSYLVAEPSFARLAAVDVYAVGPEALARRDRVIDSMSSMLAPAYTENPAVPKIAGEAIGGAIYALLRDRIRNGGPQRLPEDIPLFIYITLAPFLGPEEATLVANRRP
ncbi:MAG: TetR/AcrR family transcriptional regulator [Solirubrobacterales bacterium]